MTDPTLFAGSRTSPGYVDAFGEDARFQWPATLCFDSSYLYVTEMIGCRVRRIDPYSREVTTAAVLPAGECPYGITRHPGSGNFYVAVPGYPGSTSGAYAASIYAPHTAVGKIKVYDPDWNLIEDWQPSSDDIVWFATPSPDESEVYAAGHRNFGSPVSESRYYRIPVGGAITHTFTASGIVGASTFGPPGGIAVIGGTVYWTVTRTAGLGIYTTGLAPATAADFTRLLGWPDYTAGPLGVGFGQLLSVRQLHVGDGGNQLEFASGNSFLEASHLGDGSRIITLPSLTMTDPAVDIGVSHAGDNLAGRNQEADYVRAFGADWVVRSRIVQDSGFLMFEADGPAHSIEVYVPPIRRGGGISVSTVWGATA